MTGKILNYYNLHPRLLLLVCLLFPFTHAAVAQQDMDDVSIESKELKAGIYMLTGRGGNMAVSVGKDGPFLIDDQYAPLTEKIKRTIGELSDKPVEFLINTHLHGDHTGGNENFGESGTYIVAHKNVREFLSKKRTISRFGETQTIEASPEAALPIITFSEDINFHWNDREIHVFHVTPSHTNGDAVIYFKKANIIHTGDIFFNGFYPFFDTEHGGDFKGMLEATNKILSLIDKDTGIIPGHGPYATYDDLVKYRNMLQDVYGNMKTLIAKGKTLEEVKKEGPTRAFDNEWGDGFLEPNVWIELIYNSMTHDHTHSHK